MYKLRSVHKIPIWKPLRKRSHGARRRCFEDRIKIDLREIGYDAVEWLKLVLNGV